MTTVQQYCLRWNNHQPNFISVFSSLLLNETLVDVTLAAEGRQLQAHKVVLSACSSYFQSLFTTNPCKHPIVILKDVQYNDLKTMVDFMYYGEVNVSTEQLPQILKTAEMLKIKGLAEMPDAASVTKSDSKSSDHTDGNQSISGVESMWGSTESQQQQQQAVQQQQQQQYHTIRRTPSPSNMSPATRRKRLRKTSTGSGSINIQSGGSIERIQEEQVQQHHQQQQTTLDGRMMPKYSQPQSIDVPMSTFSVTQSGAITNVRGLKINSSPDGQLQHQQDSHEHIDESQHITEMKTEDLSCVNQTMPLDISSGTSTTPVTCPPAQQHSGGQWAVIDPNYSRFALTTSAAALPTSTVQHSSSATAHHHHHHHHHEGNVANAAQSGTNDNMSLGSNHSSSHGSNNSNSNNNATIQSQTSTPVQLQYQTTYSPQIIAVNPNNIVNNYPPSISTPTSPIVQSVYSQQSTPIQSPVNIQNSTNDGNTSASSNNVNANTSSTSGSAAPPKRKRSVNPQGEENFLRALDAVRFGGIGFCKLTQQPIQTQQPDLLFTSCSSISSPSSPISLTLSSPAIMTQTTNVLSGMNVATTGSSTTINSSTNNNNNNNSSNNNNNNNAGIGSKRGRLLIRQQRIKKDGDQTGDLETPDAGIYQEYLLSVPSSGARMERHASEPSPATSSGLISTSQSGSSNLLTVPSHSSYLIKQHSHPLLPSQSSSPSTSYTLTRQLSHPIQTTSTQQQQQQQQQQHHHQTSQIVSSHGAQDIAASGQLLQLHQQKNVPVRSQTLPHYTVTDMDFNIGSSGNEMKTQSSTQSNISSPTVVIIPDVSSDQSTIVQSQMQPQQHFIQKSSSHHLQLPSIRVKSEELQRSISSPLASTRSDLSFETTTRSSHCPTLRPGPALGCNFCWNTIDAHGRILRRKTKYHCPECQTNLCIVPCFQEYHERQSAEGNNESGVTHTNKAKGLKSSQTM